MSKFSESYLRNRSKEILSEKTEDATIFDERKENCIPRFNPKEINFGRVLGKGGFCTVSTVDYVVLNGDKNSKRQPSSNENEFFTVTQDREFISNNFIRDGKHRYALKKLTPRLFEDTDPQHFVCGVIDLAMEVKFLSILRHPNIIKMRAMADVETCTKDFFIVLDRLDLTLGEQVKLWKKEMPSGFGPNVRKRKEEFFCERLIVGYDICSALSHLHKHNIVYRDLKPANIGFDVRGDVKIFDLGLATEISESRRLAGTDTYLLTRDTGSPRYMAPEVFLGVPYNEKCDAYSFGLILWECLDLTQPFSSYNIQKMETKVYKGKDTPKVNAKWPEKVQDVLKNCWLRDISKRNSCEQINAILRAEITKMDGDAAGELDISNRTEISIGNLQI